MRPALAALFTALLTSTASAQTADTVLFNGKVVTVDKDFSVREAIAIANGKVLATGASADEKAALFSGTAARAYRLPPTLV